MDIKKITAQIPSGLDFADLRLSRDTDGHVSFDWTPIERICEASGVDIQIMREGPEDNVSGLLVAWYHAHLDHGGQPDPVAEDLIAEAKLEDKHGGGQSFPPGRA